MSHSAPTPDSTTKPVMPILTAERMKGYREGLGTINQVACDEAADEARLAALAEAEAERRRWGRFCFLCGIAVSVLFFRLVLS